MRRLYDDLTECYPAQAQLTNPAPIVPSGVPLGGTGRPVGLVQQTEQQLLAHLDTR